MGDDDRKLGAGTAWVGIASGLSGILDLITTSACLWLWLSTEDFGTATLAGAVLPVMERLANAGMSAALVRWGDADRRALSTLMWLSTAASCAVLAAVIGLAPSIGRAFGAPIIGSLLIGYGVKLLLTNTYVVPEALLRRELGFDRLTRVRIAASTGDAIAKLIAAYLGAHGYPALRIWCFVIGPFVNSVVTAIGIQLCRPWRPALAFDRTVAAEGLRYGAQVAGGELMYFAYTNADYLVIGATWGKAAVGAYRLAYELVLDVVRLISLVTAEVAFPAFARPGTDERAGLLLIRFTRQNAIALVPVVAFLAVEAGDLLAVLYPPLGPAATTAARILCVIGGLRMVSFVLPAMLAGLGHAGDALRYHAIACVVLPAAFVLAAHVAPGAGYVAIAWAWAASYPLAFGVLLERALARGRVRLMRYLRSVAGILVCGAGAAAGAIAVHVALPGPPIGHLVAVAAVIVAIYTGLIARIEGITPRSILRTMRGTAEPGA